MRGRLRLLDFAQTLADRYVVLNRGAVVAAGEGRDMDKDELSRFLSI